MIAWRPRRGGCALALLAGCAGAPPNVAGAPATVTATATATTSDVAAATTARPRAAWLDAGAAAVWAGRLGEAQRALLEVADREVRRADPALDFWTELTALLRCEPPRWSPRPSRTMASEWDQLRRLVQIERLRLAATQPAATPATPSGRHSGAGAGPASAPTRLLAMNAAPAGALSWPIEGERWGDEEPSARAVADRCPLASPAQPPPSFADADPHGGRAGEAMMVRELTRTLVPTHPALPALLFEEAVLTIGAGNAADAVAPLARIPVAADGAAAGVSEPDRAQLALTWAVAADAAATADPAWRDAAVLRLRAGLAADLPHDVRRALSFRLSEQLRAGGRDEEAVAAIGAPPHGDDALGNYLALRQMEAHVKAGRPAEALAEAREALNRHRRAAIDADGTLAAIDDLALRILVGSPVTATSIEVLEALGDPSERLARVERFAQLAGALGAQASAMEAFLWLMDNDPDENRRLHHLARASVAAARAGKKAQFGRTFALLAGEAVEDEPAPADAKHKEPPQALAQKAPAKAPAKASTAKGLIDSPAADRLYGSRQRERSLNWQRAMLVVARDALPALVDSDDQVNLKILVDRLQRHLTAHGRGPVDAELTTIYRAASAHLRTGARGYAERVGNARPPILLGDIAVERRYDVIPPAVTLRPRGPRGLLWVPAVGTDPSAARLRPWVAPLGVRLAIKDARP